MSRAIRSAIALALLLSTATEARADDASELEGLLNEKVVTSASKSSEVTSNAPATSVVITGDDLRRYGIRTLGEAIDFLGIGGHGSANMEDGEMGARGLTLKGNTHFLVLLDGHHVNDPIKGTARFGRMAGVPMELVDHIEFILGPGAVLYGSNAMQGVVNVVTKSARDYHGAKVGVESELLTSVRPWAGWGHEFMLLGKPSEVTVQVEYYKKDGPFFQFGPQNTGIDPTTGKPARYSRDPEGTGIWGGRARSNFTEVPSGVLRFVSGAFEVNVRAMASRQSYWIPESDFTDPANRILERRFSVDIKHRADISPIVHVTSRLYADSMDNQTIYVASHGPNCMIPTITCRWASLDIAKWAGVEVQSTLDWLQNEKLVTLIGVDPRVRMAQSLGNGTNTRSERPIVPSLGVIERTDASGGAYAQQTWQPTPWLGLNGAARIDYDPRFSPVISPRVAITTKPWRGGTLKAFYSEAFRAPTFYESYFETPYIPPAFNLQPERVRSWESSLEQKFGANRYYFGAFTATYSHLIENHRFTEQEAEQWVQEGKWILPPQFQIRNVASIRNYGFNTGFEGSTGMGTLRYGFNLTVAQGNKRDEAGRVGPLTASPRAFGNMHVSYDLPGHLPVVALAAQFVGKRASDHAFTGGFRPTPYAPPQLALKATLSGDVPGVRGLSYRGTLDYAIADRSPHIVGPIIGATPNHSAPELVPVDTLRATVGLEYGF